MSVAIEQSFVQSAAKLGAEATRVWDFVGRYLDDNTRRGMSMERLDRIKTKGLWSARVTRDLRAIVYRDGPDDYLLYVDNHDPAYNWAEKRRVARNPRTKRIQVYPTPDEIERPTAPTPRPAPDTPQLPPPFADHDDDYLLSLGLPEEWLPFIRAVVDVDDLLHGVQELPADVADRLIAVASGHVVPPPAPVVAETTMERVIESSDGTVSPDPNDLERLLSSPFSTWIAFLHPSQRGTATADFSGPSKVTGTAGTGKTVVAMHRARHLARQGRRVLLTSFVTTLCQNIQRSLETLCDPDELTRIEVSTVHQVAHQLVQQACKAPSDILDDDKIRELIERFGAGKALPIGNSAMVAEWNLVVKAQGIDDWDAYRAASRAGRGTPLTAVQRREVWSVFDRLVAYLRTGNVTDYQGLCRTARELVEAGEVTPGWDSVVVDEVQDLSAQALRLVAVLGGGEPNGLMVLGDGGQRIFAHRTSLRATGIEVRGRARVLRINYRTTEQIRRFADRTLTSADDLDGDPEQRNAFRSIRSGGEPVAIAFPTAADQYDYVAEYVNECVERGVAPNEIALFARTRTQLDRAAECLHKWDVKTQLLEPRSGVSPDDAVQLVTMHRAKGLEFKMAVVIDASRDAIPNRYAMNRAGDDQDRAEFRERERQLLYVALTRARDEVLITWVGEPCEFLEPALKRSGEVSE